MLNPKPSTTRTTLFMAALLLAATASATYAANIRSIDDGDWSDDTIWQVTSGIDADNIPDADDNVSIEGTVAVSVTDDRECLTLVTSADTPNSLDLTGATASLIVNGDFTNGGTFTASSATILTVTGNVSNNKSFAVIDSTAVVNGNFSNSDTLSATGASVIDLDGNLTANGLNTINELQINGTGAQSISGTGSLTITTLTVDKSSNNLTLNRSVTVGSSFGAILNLNNGQVLTSSTNLLILRTPATTTVGTLTQTNGYVNPIFRRDITNSAQPLLTDYLYAVGTGSGYTPVTYDFTTGSTAAGFITVDARDGDHPAVTSPPFPATTDPDDALDRWWDITQSGISNYAANITFRYLNADVNAGRDEADYRVARYNGPGFLFTTFNTTMTPASNDGEGNGLTQAGQYTLLQQPDPPLAVTLTSLTASAAGIGSTVAIDWTTAAEINNVGFHVYRAEGGYKGERLTSSPIPAQGDEFNGAAYQFVDTLPLAAGETRAYFLEDIDASSVTTLHGPASVSAPTANADDALDSLDLTNWESGSAAPYTAPDFTTPAGELGLAIPNGGSEVFGFWQTRSTLAPVPAGTYILKVHVAWDAAESATVPDVRVRVFEADNAANHMTHTVDRTALGKELPSVIDTVWTSDGSSEWRVAIDLLSFVDGQAGGFRILGVENIPVVE
jgi:hypothetical protein